MKIKKVIERFALASPATGNFYIEEENKSEETLYITMVETVQGDNVQLTKIKIGLQTYLLATEESFMVRIAPFVPWKYGMVLEVRGKAPRLETGHSQKVKILISCEEREETNDDH